MNRTPSELTCRVLHTVALMDATHTHPAALSPHFTDHMRATRCSSDPQHTRNDLINVAPPTCASPIQKTSPIYTERTNARGEPCSSPHTMPTHMLPNTPPSEVIPSHRPTSSAAESRGFSSPAPASDPLLPERDAPELLSRWETDGAYLRTQREVLQHREHLLRQRVDAGVGKPALGGDAPLKRVKVMASTKHVAAQPYRRVQCVADGRQTYQLWLHMKDAAPTPDFSGSHAQIATAEGARTIPVAAPPDPLAALWDGAARRYEHDYLRQEQQLQRLRPDLWSRALPSYAALDGVPQLIDNDRGQSFSRVRRIVQDDGIAYVQ